MKKRFTFLNAIMSVAIGFQSVHNFEHLLEQISEKKCLHERHFETEITHQHKSLDQCFVCEFAFSSYVISSLDNFEFENSLCFFEQNSFSNTTFSYYFKGISYPLRGPPTV